MGAQVWLRFAWQHAGLESFPQHSAMFGPILPWVVLSLALGAAEGTNVTLSFHLRGSAQTEPQPSKPSAVSNITTWDNTTQNNLSMFDLLDLDAHQEVDSINISNTSIVEVNLTRRGRRRRRCSWWCGRCFCR